MAKGSISAAFTAQANTSAKMKPPAPHALGMNQTIAAAGASMTRKTTNARAYMMMVSHAAFRSITL